MGDVIPAYGSLTPAQRGTYDAWKGENPGASHQSLIEAVMRERLGLQGCDQPREEMAALVGRNHDRDRGFAVLHRPNAHPSARLGGSPRRDAAIPMSSSTSTLASIKRLSTPAQVPGCVPYTRRSNRRLSDTGACTRARSWTNWGFRSMSTL